MVSCLQVYVLKPSHKSTLQSKTIETPLPDSVTAVQNATNATRDVESEFEAGYEGKIREIVMDNVDPSTTVCFIVKHVPFFCPYKKFIAAYEVDRQNIRRITTYKLYMYLEFWLILLVRGFIYTRILCFFVTES